MKKNYHYFVLFAVAIMAVGCTPPNIEDPMGGLDNQLQVGDRFLDISHTSRQTWYGTMNYPVNTVEVYLAGEGGVYHQETGLFDPYATVRIRFFVPEGNDRKLTPGTYSIVPEPKLKELMSEVHASECSVWFNVTDGGIRGEGVSGTVTVAVSGDEYTITTKGIHQTYGDLPVRLAYRGPLQQSIDEGTTGASSFKFGDDSTIWEVAQVVKKRGVHSAIGRYGTTFKFRIRPSNIYYLYLEGEFTLSHDSPELTSGTYTINSAYGERFNLSLNLTGFYTYAGGYSIENGGSVAVDISGDSYTLTMNDVTARDDSGVSMPLTGGYTGWIMERD